MIVEVIWSDVALNDIRALGDYLAERNPSAARAVLTRIRDAERQLFVAPWSGAASRAFGPPTRILVRAPYLVIHDVTRASDDGPTLVRVLRVVDGRRDLSRIGLPSSAENE